MLVNTNDVANRLKITNRAVQNKCKNAGLKKIGNQYQITSDIAEQWYSEAQETKETKQNRSADNYRTSHRSDKSNSLLMWVTAFITATVLIIFYLNLDSQISYLKQENKENSKMYDLETKATQKRLNDAFDVIHSQDLEIQYLKIKDSITTRKIKL